MGGVVGARVEHCAGRSEEKKNPASLGMLCWQGTLGRQSKSLLMQLGGGERLFLVVPLALRRIGK